MKTFKYSLIVFVSILCIFAVQVTAFADFDVAAESAVLMEASTGQILFEKNADVPMPPASITKLMTLTLIFDALENGRGKLDDMVTVSEEAWRMGGSQMFLEVGQQAKFEDLITGISVVSANDACVAVAEHLYGSERAFVEDMNKRAKELGMTNSYFRNSTGLPEEGHHMSARDIAVLAHHLISKYPRILEIESQRNFTYNNILQYNRNPLLGSFPGADGLKTGWTEEAGYCLVGTAKQENERMISVVLNTRDDKERLTVSKELLNYGFRNFEVVTAANAGEIVGQAAVRDGKKIELPVKTEKPVTVVVPFGSDKSQIKKVLVNTASLTAPVSAGTPAAELEVQLNGKVLTRAKLVAAEEVQRANWFIRMLRAIFRFFWPGYKG